MEETKRLKLAVVAGASRAIKYKESKPNASEREVMNDVMRNIREIIKNINLY